MAYTLHLIWEKSPIKGIIEFHISPSQEVIGFSFIGNPAHLRSPPNASFCKYPIPTDVITLPYTP